MFRSFRVVSLATVVCALSITTCDNSVQDSLADRSMPSLAGAKALSRHYVEVNFASEVGAAAEQASRYAIVKSDRTPLSIDAVTRGEVAGQIILMTDTQQPDEQYYLTVEGSALDTASVGAGQQAEEFPGAVNFLGSGSLEPTLLSATSLSNTQVLLIFGVPMDRPTTQTKANYRISNPDLNISSATLATGDVALTLVTSPQEDFEYNVVAANIRSNIPNYGGFYVDPEHDSAVFQGIALNDTTKPKLVSAQASDYSTIVLTFNEPVENFASDVASYSVTPSLVVLGVTLNEWGTQATLLVQPVVAGTNYTVAVSSVVEDRSGNVIDPAFRTAVFGVAADETTKPTLVSAVAIDCETILATFSEPMADSAGDPSNYSIDPAIVIINAQLSEFKTQVLFTVQSLAVGVEHTLTANNVEDSVGNVIDTDHDEATFMCEAGTNTAELGPLPRVVGAASLGNTVVLVGYDRPMGESAIDTSRYFIVQTNVNGEVGTLVIQSAEFLDAEDTSLVKLTTTSQNEVTYQVTAVGVRDEQGNPLAPKIGFNGLILQDPTSAVFPGTPPGGGELTDTDEDGVLDNEELRGRIVQVKLLGGETIEREVTSNPFLPDTDDDGLGDLTERTLNINPRDADTDGDALSDEREFNFFYSNPAAQDSDEDGTDDGLEVSFFKTAPHLADTDGDGFDDGKELYELSRNPNVADLPRPNIKANNIRLLINEKYTFQDTEGNTQSTTSSTQSTLTQSEETKFSTSDTDVLKVGVEASLEISATPSFTIGGSFGAEWTTQTTSESSQMAQQQYQNSVSRAREISSTRQVTREIVGASVNATVTIVNEGDIAFTIGNIEVSALQQGGPGRKQFLPVATLVPAGGNNTFNLGPLIPERGPFIFQNTDVFPNLVDNLLREPRGLVLKVANFDMTDEFGRNFAFTSQEVNDRTSEIRFDFGDGRSESYRVATYGGLDDGGFAGPAGEYVGGFNAIGETAGIPLDFALQDILGLVKNPPDFDAVVAGEDGFANTVAAGDDVQEIPPATPGLDDRAIVVSAGANGILDTAAVGGDDEFAKTRGYDTSPTCNELTSERIIEPLNFGNGTADTDAIGDDVQVIAVGAAAAAGAIVVGPGPNGVLDTVRMGDDVRLGPGDPCTMNSQCPGGTCDAREVITRIENSINGDRNRFWVALTSDQIPVGTDVGQVNLQPGFVILLAFIQDVDRDGLPAQEEYVHGSSDTDKDSDDDTLGDFAEVRLGWVVELVSGPYQAYPDPRLADSDGDGKTDTEEFMARTDPRLNDTDLDGIKDNFECDNESGDPMFDIVTECTPNGSNNVVLPLEAMTLDPLNPDSDGDGLDDGSEIELGTCPLDRQDGPQFLDSDEDGLTNSEETTPRTISFVNCSGATVMVFNVTTDPLNGDTDFDGLPDALEVGKASLGLPALSNPEDVDTDNDGLLDYDEFANFAFFQYVGSEYAGFILDGATSQQIGSNPSDCDSDNDSLTDSFEHVGSWGVLAFGDDMAREVMSNPLVADSDLDGRNDGQEFRGADGIGYGQPGDSGDATDPMDPDTDGDDRTDGEEVAFGSNPLRADLGVSISVVGFGDVDGHSGGGNDWDFHINVRRPITGHVNTLLTDQNFSPVASNACTNYWQAPSDFTSVGAPFNLARFGLNIGDPIVVEGRWIDVSGCSGSTIVANCTMLFSETFTSEQMASQGFISHMFDLMDNDCHVVFTLEITVN